MKIYGMEKLSLVDYDGYTACTLFTGGCNFRCPYCHNSGLVLDAESSPPLDEIEIFYYLTKRKGLLDGVVISGGEPTLNADLPSFIRRIKQIGYKVKLDTNGTNYAMLRDLVEQKLVDFVAMDIKNCQEKYALTVGYDKVDLASIKKSVELLKQNKVDYEFRTTVVKELHTADDVKSLAKWLSGAKKYVLQAFVDRESCICSGLHPIPAETAESFKQILNTEIAAVYLRGY